MGSKRVSIVKSTVLLRRVLHVVLLAILMVVLWGLVSVVLHKQHDVVYGSLVRELNSFAIMIQQHPVEVSPALADKYDAVLRVSKKLGRAVLLDASLEPPDYTSSDGQEAYRRQLQQFMAAIRTNLDDIDDTMRMVELILLVVALVSVLVSLVFLRIHASFQSLFIADVNRGVEEIQQIQQYRESRLSPEYSRILELRQFYYGIEKIYRGFHFNRTLQEIDIHGNLVELLKQLFTIFNGFMNCDRVALAFLTSDKILHAETAYASYTNLKLEPGFSEPLSDTSLEKILPQEGSRIINNLKEYSKNRQVSQATSLLLKEGVHSSIAVPLFFQLKTVGYVFVSTREKIDYTQAQADEANREVNILKQKLYIEFLLERTISETSNAFVSLMSEKDNETAFHIKRMSSYSYYIGKAYSDTVSSLSPRFLRELFWYAALHDIGKIGTPDAILHKSGPLDEAEWEVMREHVLIGERIIKTMNTNLENIFNYPLMKTAVDIISGHHEKMDGSGYPRGLQGEAIPLAGRIVAAADVFDALTSRRPYKEAYSVEESLRIMKGEMPGHFDPVVVTCLEKAMPAIMEIYSEYKET